MSRAVKIWNTFVEHPGASVDGVVGIASPYAIEGLIRTIERQRPSSILEIGSGIGTLTFATLDTIARVGSPQTEVVTVENNAFCISELHRNLSHYRGRYRHLSNLTQLKRKGDQFDLIVVDGGGDLPNDMGVMDLSGLLAKGGQIFVEGNRSFQRSRIETWYRGRSYAHTKLSPTSTHLAAPDPETRAKNKGYHILTFEPSFLVRASMSLRHRSNDLLVRLARRFSNQLSNPVPDQT